MLTIQETLIIVGWKLKVTFKLMALVIVDVYVRFSYANFILLRTLCIKKISIFFSCRPQYYGSEPWFRI